MGLFCIFTTQKASTLNFRTEIKITESYPTINHESKILLLGSCFSENIGNKLAFFKFKQKTNPYGVLFHPKAIETLVNDCIDEKQYLGSDLFSFNDLFHSYHHHSSFSNSSEEKVLYKINNAIQNTTFFLKKASHLVITLGTAWAYRHKKTGNIVANCHKIPQKAFEKVLLSTNEIEECLHRIQKRVIAFNPSLKIIFTLSPVRHLKDGFTENTLSKSHLNAAIHQICKAENCFYFPAYEIVMDDLRDYRFYKKDMLHPNAVAIDYIWEQFSKNWISEGSKEHFKIIESIQKGLLHKPFQEESPEYLKFLKNLESKKNLLKKKLKIEF
jgi:hypothetical protein